MKNDSHKNIDELVSIPLCIEFDYCNNDIIKHKCIW